MLGLLNLAFHHCRRHHQVITNHVRIHPTGLIPSIVVIILIQQITEAITICICGQLGSCLRQIGSLLQRNQTNHLHRRLDPSCTEAITINVGWNGCCECLVCSTCIFLRICPTVTIRQYLRCFQYHPVCVVPFTVVIRESIRRVFYSIIVVIGIVSIADAVTSICWSLFSAMSVQPSLVINPFGRKLLGCQNLDTRLYSIAHTIRASWQLSPMPFPAVSETGTCIILAQPSFVCSFITSVCIRLPFGVFIGMHQHLFIRHYPYRRCSSMLNRNYTTDVFAVILIRH